MNHKMSWRIGIYGGRTLADALAVNAEAGDLAIDRAAITALRNAHRGERRAGMVNMPPVATSPINDFPIRG